MPSQLDLEAVRRAWEELPNIRVVDNPAASRRDCIVYFSSHGLYFPDEEEVARESLWTRARYEWSNLDPGTAARRVFVRDPLKQWYLSGVSKELPTQGALAQHLRALTSGYSVACVGNSAGGYAAALLGCQLGATHVLAISPQFDLREELAGPGAEDRNPLLAEHARSGDLDLDLHGRLASTKTVVYSLYAGSSPQDQLQQTKVAGLTSVRSLGFTTSQHGAACWPSSYPPLLRSDADELASLCDRFVGGVVSPRRFALAVEGFVPTVRQSVRRVAHRRRA